MPATTFDDERTYNDHRFATSEVFRSDQLKVICGYFKPEQFIPVHSPASDVAIHVQSGTGIVRDGDTEHRVTPGDVVVVEANTARRITADADTRLETLLVTAPPPTDEEHKPVRKGLQNNEFEP